MSYKTILVQLNDEHRVEQILRPAVRVAMKHESHVIGLHISPGIPYTPPIPGAGGVIGLIKEHERKVSEKIAAQFDELTKGRGFVTEMRHLSPKSHDDISQLLLSHARSVDLIVAAAPGAQTETASIMDFPERLAVESGRPVLMSPVEGYANDFGKHVLIAWNGKREAARATFDAMPFLKAAEKVTVLCIEQVRSEKDVTPLPDVAIAETLARHGVNVALKTARARDTSIGEEILLQITQEEADMLVMGAYGHTRLREFVFGGATRHIARNLHVPTLLSH